LKNLDRALAAAGCLRDDFRVVVTPQQASPNTIQAYADLGVERLVKAAG
jgi:hypothetical protein